MPTQEWKCKSCNRKFSGDIPYQQHLQSARHIKNSEHPKQESCIHCKFCIKDFSGVESYIAHVVGKEHLRIIGNIEKTEKASILELFRKKPDSMKCPECDVPFTCWTSADDHFCSEQHIKKISDDEKAKELSQLKPKSPCKQNSCQSRCNLCDVALYGEEAIKLHEKGKKHRKRMEKVTAESQNNIATSVNDIKSSSKTDLREKCFICNVSLLGQEAIEKHCIGKNHLKKMAELDKKCSNSGTVCLSSQSNTKIAQKPLNDEELAKQIQKINMEKQRTPAITESCSDNSNNPLSTLSHNSTLVVNLKCNMYNTKSDKEVEKNNIDKEIQIRNPELLKTEKSTSGMKNAIAISQNNVATSSVIDIKSSSKTDLREECFICNVSLLGQESMEKHYVGKNHLKKEAELDKKCSNSGTICLPSQSNTKIAQKPLNNEELAKQIQKLNMEKQRPPSITESCSDNSNNILSTVLSNFNSLVKLTCNMYNMKSDKEVEKNDTEKEIQIRNIELLKSEKLINDNKKENNEKQNTSKNTYLHHRFESPTMKKNLCDIEFKAKLQQFESKQCELQNINVDVNTGLCGTENSTQTNEMQILKDNKLETAISSDLNGVFLSGGVSDSLFIKKTPPTNNNSKINQQNLINNKSPEMPSGRQVKNNRMELSCRTELNSVVSGESLNDNINWQKGCVHCGICSFRDKSAYKRHIKTEAHITKMFEGL